MTKKIIHIISLLVIVSITGCSGRKNNAATRAYHAFTARYNTYYNGDLAYKQGLKEQSSGHKDNYLEQLPLLIISNKNTKKIGGSNYDRAIEKAQKAIKNSFCLLTLSVCTCAGLCQTESTKFFTFCKGN